MGHFQKKHSFIAAGGRVECKATVIFKFLSVLNTLTCLSAMYVDSELGIDSYAAAIGSFPGENESWKSGRNVQTTSDEQVNVPLLPQSLKQTSSGNSIESRDGGNDIQNQCKFDGDEKVVCSGFVWREELIDARLNFLNVRQVAFVNLTSNNGFESEGVSIADLRFVFPQAKSLSFLNIVNHNKTSASRIVIKAEGTSTGGVKRFLSTFPAKSELESDAESGVGRWMWESVEELSFGGNSIESEWIPGTLLKLFPNLKRLDLSGNEISNLEMLNEVELKRLESIDLSGNPLDCTKDYDWIQSEPAGPALLNADGTVCALPPHQNKPKPILKVYPFVKEVRDQCRLNCSCFVEYIWEQRGGEIHSKNAVNCSSRNLLDFPDPNTLPRQTDTLYLNNNEIHSLESFTGDERYLKLGLMNLFLNDNRITSINPLEGSDWLDDFQILSLRNNELTEVPVYVLENVLRQNKRLYFIDLSSNPWSCDCRTVTTLKVWLLRYGNFVKNVEDVRCSSTNEQIRHMKMEEWCDMDDDEAPLVEILDLVSITLALLIIAIICKVYYDYWNYKRNGRLPWLVSKM